MSAPRLIASGRWAAEGGTSVTMTDAPEQPVAQVSSSDAVVWKVGQLVEVQSRTWAGINRPGGHGKICRIHYKNNDESKGIVESLDVKYTISSGCDTLLDPDLVKPYEELNPRGRSRRARSVFAPSEETKKKSCASSKQRKPPVGRKPLEKENHKQADQQAKKSQKKTEKRRRKVFAKKYAVAPPRMRFLAAKSEEASLGDGIPAEISVPTKKKGTSTPLVKISPLGAGFSRTQLRKRPSSPTFHDTSYHESNSVISPKFRVGSEEHNDDTHNNEMLSDAAIPRTTQLATGHIADMDIDDGTSPEVSPPSNMDSGPGADGADNIHQPMVHLTLEKVYNDGRRDAAKFIDNVVAGRNTNNAPEKDDEDVEMKPPPVECDERQNRFQSLLNHLLLVNDSMVEESGVMDSVNRLSQQNGEGGDDNMQFTADETSQFLKNLAEQNKVMVTDGLILGI